VNISSLQLNPDFPHLVARTIAQHGISPDQLEIELTESAIMRDAELGIRLLHELKALGVQLSIDDFGTGYSSLAYLKRLPMGTVKIDQSFVRDTPDDQDAVSITRAIVALGHLMHMKIIAEGVETQGQVEFLCKNGCDLLQGFFFSKAVTGADFVRLLAEKGKFELPEYKEAPAIHLMSSKRGYG
jgi:EAL domain-containing protein (putative c-di-GMP-specific phosphodiesterase class I)